MEKKAGEKTEEERTTLGLTVKKSDFSEWYRQVIVKSELMDYTAVSGCMVFRPYSYAIWERVQQEVDRRLRKLGVKNAYFPMFIPESLLNREADHVKGFKPEVAWVTHGGDTKLGERLAVRPTSEAIMYDSYSKWVRSWRDLPLRLNQWNSVVRWEFKDAVPFLRTREFLWNEGHSAFATREEAEKEISDILEVYRQVAEDYMALYGFLGRKSDSEKFAGAEYTCSFEYLIPSGKAVQGPDAHFDGQNFAKAYDIKFADKDKQQKYVWQNTWAITTRMLGVMFAVHGDDKGLVLPPRIAPIQVVIIPVIFEKNKKTVLNKCKEVKETLEKQFSVELDDREGYSAGFKFNEWELKGVPLRMEIGPRDVEKNQAVLVRRDDGSKETVKMADMGKRMKAALDEMQKNLFENSKKFLRENTHEAGTMKDFKRMIERRGMIISNWCGDAKCEENIKEETGATIRCVPFEKIDRKGRCVLCGKDCSLRVYFARAY